jgi:plastocyanin
MRAIPILAGILMLLVLMSGCEKTQTQDGTVTAQEEGTAEETQEEERTAEENKALLEQLTQEAQQEQEEEAEEPEPEPLETNITITIANFKGTPKDVEIAVGGEITWVNNMPNFLHIIGIRERKETGTWEDFPINEIEDAQIMEGESYSFTLDVEPGEYQWYSKTKYPTTSGIITVKEQPAE